MHHLDLADGWTVVPADPSTVPAEIAAFGDLPASVPGSIHTDLLAARLIDDPYLDDNEALQSWIGRTDWTYSRVVEWVPDGSERQEIVFDGLDTVARIVLNGIELGNTRNMHRSFRFDVTDILRPGENDLTVEFSSPVRAADAASLALGYRPHVNHHPYNALRKMACSFGWDWGIDTATSGIWRPVRLESWSMARLAEVRVVATVENHVPIARIAAIVDVVDPEQLTLLVRVAGIETEVEVSSHGGLVELELAVPDAELWWPRGHGDQPLYDLQIELSGPGGTVDSHAHRVGFRSVRVDTAPDGEGTAPFTFIINGEVVLVRGANWIPDDAFPHRVDRARYARRLAQAEFAGINLIRVWGGGIYESDDFYAECDERGLLVWQDFALACAAYAEEDPLRSEIEAEAREAVVRLASHPSLVLLNGNNENIWGHQEWNWKLRLDGRTWGSYYYYEYFPALVEELAPQVAYTPGSPFSPDRDARQNDENQGSMHIWDLWNQKDYPHYRDYRPRFVAEFGWQGPPTWSTLTQSISDQPLTPESPGMLVHQKAMEGNVKLTDGLIPHFALPDDMADWHWAMSLNQAVAIRTGIEWFRSLTPWCSGTVVWQLNDSWPATSWSAVDGYERRKPLLFALRQAHAERLLTIQPSDDGFAVVALDDTAEPWVGELEIERIDVTGSVLASVVVPLSVAARDAVTVIVPDAIARSADPARELIVARFEGARALWFFADYRDGELAAPDVDVDAVRTVDGWVVEVSARSLVRELSLLVDRVDADAVVDDALVTLLPGETAVFTVVGAGDASEGDFAHPSVLRSANDLVSSRVLR
ncbi:glycoside hydrolase family 2 protein [Lacisediminihabitans sp. G11-30]|uniref:beta-mannosidase n=2 Tax=Lacisediminihabitans changchengi TaxID=2787634 RepID=A0A934SKN8_9MICO|nr:glycoside hydrolase family 2 protein [Lacisediminihabitans changchengi]